MLLFKAVCIFIIPTDSSVEKSSSILTQTYILARDRETATREAAKIVADFEYKYSGRIEELTLVAAQARDAATYKLIIADQEEDK